MGARWNRVQDGADYAFGARHYRAVYGLRAAGALARGTWWLTKRVLLPLAVVAGVVALVWFVGGASWRFAVEHNLLRIALIAVGAFTGLACLRWLFRRRGPLRKMIRRNF
ncbi:hypothetical protein [Phytomonospora endophytica]|uniref:Uncharacterized protein n=1 Tax=Phytomonospora endophytica TaxID=714109 RepID=A0A841FWV8_9ACTN|nr:hypothetical protein [Phytomonospora endophytica]MBB6038218.1 hypothetical protein [Phytomonospora endophytica]